jgi:antitoxin FitA
MLFGVIFACNHGDHMSVVISVRNVSAKMHRKLKARAALEEMSVSDYLLRELRSLLDRPTLDEMRRRLERRHPVRLRPSPAAAVRAERKRR